MRGWICAAGLALLGPSASAQEPLADGVADFLGGRYAAAWFVADGRVWRTDGTAAGTFDTGVPDGPRSDATERLIVYRPDRIDWIDASGAVTRLVPPAPYEGFDRDAHAPRLWRRALSRPDAEILELFEWTVPGFRSTWSGVSNPPSGFTSIDRVILTPERYFVVWFNDFTGVEYVVDLFDHGSVGDQGWQLTADGSTGGVRTWSGGHLFLGEAYRGIPQRDAFQVAKGEAWGAFVELPASWGWGLHDWTVLEFIPGQPFVDWNSGDGNLAFLSPDLRPFPDPPGAWLGYIETEAGLRLAHVDQGSARPVFALDPAVGTWEPTAGLGSPDRIDRLGEHGGATYLIAARGAVVDLLRFDSASRAAATFATGLAAVERGLCALGEGFVFVADDGVHGSELWYSDGTAAGTRLAADLAAGALASQPRGFTALGPRVLFATADGPALRVWSIEPQHLGWRRNPQSGRSYRIGEAVDWDRADRAARDLGGSLATVRDQAEQDWLRSTFGPAEPWIGLWDRDRNGIFVWRSGEIPTFTAWCPGEPNQSDPRRTAVHLAEAPPWCSGGWRTAFPTEPHPFLVERATPAAPIENFGLGCRADPSLPIARARWASGWPRPGGLVDLRFLLGNGYELQAAAILGLSSTRFAGLELPLDLGFAGAPGCALAAAADDLIPLGTARFESRLLLRLPNDPGLCDRQLFFQGLLLGPQGLVATSDALRLTISR
jgi:ELWxxDGT repeat protein